MRLVRSVGLMQQPYRQDDTLSFVSARFADSLAINGLSINDQTLQHLNQEKTSPKSLTKLS